MFMKVSDLTVGELKLIQEELSKRPAVHDDATLGEVFGYGDPEPELLTTDLLSQESLDTLQQHLDTAPASSPAGEKATE